jgi:hypothetical protein
MGRTKNPLSHGCIISILRWPLPVLVAINPVQKVALIAVPDDSYCGSLQVLVVNPESVKTFVCAFELFKV